MDSMVGNEWMEVFSEELINLNMYFFCTCNSFLNNFVLLIWPKVKVVFDSFQVFL